MMSTKPIRFKRFFGHLASLLIAGVITLSSTPALAATTEVIRSYSNWPTTWIALMELNDAYDGMAIRDFVGDTNNPCGFYAFNNDYVFFRQRIHTNTADRALFDSAFFVIIDVVGTNYVNATADTKLPDYSFTWDAANDGVKEPSHGLEMQICKSQNAQWSGVDFSDIDGTANNDKKLVEDINYLTRTDGCVRVISEQLTTNFAQTTFIDYAVKWSYLQTYTKLNSNQTWRVTFASNTATKTDHDFLNADIAGGANLTSNSTTSGWASVVTTPTGAAPPPQGSYFAFE